jgi:hypothetical protein
MYTQVLNLTGALIKMVNPADSLKYIDLIDNLTVLEMGENQVRSWNTTLFKSNPRLEVFKMPKNGHEILFTEEMIFDFFNNTRLKELDLSENNFICSEQVFNLSFNYILLVGWKVLHTGNGALFEPDNCGIYEWHRLLLH